jgi:hypothetical protein
MTPKPPVEAWIDELEAKVRRLREGAVDLVSICDADLAAFIGDAATMADQVRLAVRDENEACAKIADYRWRCGECDGACTKGLAAVIRDRI